MEETPGTERNLSVAVAAGNDVPAGNPVVQSLFETMRQHISKGEWLPGQRLPSITQLAKAFNVSTGSMREALRSLQSIGLVQIEHGRGVFVASARPILPLDDYTNNVTNDLLIALAETRRILEPELAALAAERGTAEELAEIEQLALQMEAEAAVGRDFVEPDVLFHHRIAQATHNPVLQRLIESVSDLMLESRKRTAVEPGMTARAVRYHLLIAEALRERNGPQARLLMLAHMNDALSSLLLGQKKE
ncbi:MAG: FadR family transcriptional regulator [Chloroflexaceae bacterium]|nr:FadR family transcriptional regulator [Chloroflexaceae bacterium]